MSRISGAFISFADKFQKNPRTSDEESPAAVLYTKIVYWVESENILKIFGCVILLDIK